MLGQVGIDVDEAILPEGDDQWIPGLPTFLLDQRMVFFLFCCGMGAFARLALVRTRSFRSSSVPQNRRAIGRSATQSQGSGARVEKSR